jgi:hypothetical protein
VSGTGRYLSLAPLSSTIRHGTFRVADGLTKRDVAMFCVVMIIAAVLAVMATYYIIQSVLPSDPSDPLTKAGGLKPGQTIQAK